MSDKMTLDMPGLDAIIRKIKQMEAKAQGKVIRPALRAGAKVARVAVKARTPVDSGKLKGATKVRAGRRKKGVISILVTQGKKDNAFAGKTFYGGFREYGHHLGKRASNKDIGVKKRKRLTSSQKAEIAALDKSRPFVEGSHHMEEGFKASKGAASEAIVNTMRAKISELAK